MKIKDLRKLAVTDSDKTLLKQEVAKREAIEKVAAYNKYSKLLNSKISAKISTYIKKYKQVTNGYICLHGDIENVCVVHTGRVTVDHTGKITDHDLDDVYSHGCSKHDEDTICIYTLLDETEGIDEFNELRKLVGKGYL